MEICNLDDNVIGTTKPPSGFITADGVLESLTPFASFDFAQEAGNSSLSVVETSVVKPIEEN